MGGGKYRPAETSCCVRSVGALTVPLVIPLGGLTLVYSCDTELIGFVLVPVGEVQKVPRRGLAAAKDIGSPPVTAASCC